MVPPGPAEIERLGVVTGARFERKVAVVTGGARGIGESIARLIVEEGGAVVVADLADEAGRVLVDALGDRSCFVQADVSVEADVERAVTAATETFGCLDIMVNNAGIVGPDRSITDITIDDYRDLTDVLVLGVLLGTKHAARSMLDQRGGGAIVNIASIAALRGGFGPHLYTMAKHAVVGLTRAMATELVSHDIRVNCVAPGGIPTPMGARHVYGDESRVEDLAVSIAARSPMSRGSAPRDIAEAVLASDAAGYVTGETLTVDAGAVVAPARQPSPTHRDEWNTSEV